MVNGLFGSTEYGRRPGKGAVMLAVFVVVMSTVAGCGKEKTPKVLPEIIPIDEPQVQTGSMFITPAVSEESQDSALTTEEETVEELVVDMTKVRAFDKAKTMYAVSNVNIRKGPDTAYEPVGMIKLGSSVEVIGQDEGGWYELMYHDEIAFVCDDYISDEEPVFEEEEEAEEASEQDKIVSDEEMAMKIEDELIASIEGQVSPEVTPEAPDVIDPADVLIIGDSRCVMMKNATGGGGCSWICQISKGYKWLSETAIPEADEMIGNGTKVVIALGVNDVGNVNKYAALVNAKASEWAEKGAVTYYVSVNPVSNNARVSESQVEFFNSKIQGQLSGIKWIDTHSYLMENGFNATDGIHYDNPTSRKLFQAIMDRL